MFVFGHDEHKKFDIDVKIFTDVLREDTEKGTPLVGAIDQGTSSTRFVIFTPKGRIAASSQMEHTQIFPPGEDKVGWHEHDPLEIWENVKACIASVAQKLSSHGYGKKVRPWATVGITNQRETTVAWNAFTGKPYYNAIVWDDTRTTTVATDIAKGNTNRLRKKTGLPIASYFAGTKVKWLLDHCEGLAKDMGATPEAVRFGTIDTWLLYQLTGIDSTDPDAANVGGIFVTDVTNASRWLFCDINTVQWSMDLVHDVCAPHKLEPTALPKIVKSSHTYCTCQKTCGVEALDGVPVSSILGDQQAALFGQCAFAPGEAKNTYGTGMFLMMNTGSKLVPSTHGMLTTIACQIGDEGVQYALEGSVSHSGSTIQWLRDQLNIIPNAAESEALASTVHSNDGLYLVPAFAGLFAPYWRSDARACIVGMTATHNKAHICRAALEATAYQAREVFDAIYADSNVKLTSLKVDGGGTNNSLLMQFQADIIDVPVVQPKVMETTAMGAAFAAGLAVGVWKGKEEIKEMWHVARTWTPSMSEAEKQKNWEGWQKAVTKSFGWEKTTDGEAGDDAEDDVAGAHAANRTHELPRVLDKFDLLDALGKSKAAIVPVVLTATASFVAGIMIGGRNR